MMIPAIGPAAARTLNTATEAISGTSGSDFGAMIEGIGRSAVTSIQNAELQSMSAISGQGSVRDMASAVMEAERSLQIAVSVRDKIVSAFLEISRMAI